MTAEPAPPGVDPGGPPRPPAPAGPSAVGAPAGVSAAELPEDDDFGPGVAGIADRCAAAAQRRGDQLYGTAAPVPRWLLIELPNAWGRDALQDSGLDPAVARTLAERARAARARVVLIRRPGRAEPAEVRRLAWVDSRPGREGAWWGSWRDDRDLLAVSPDQPAGTRSTEPAYLVCAHGRHDACCAIRGRPVAAALAAVRPDSVWECSHVGGDRFAANVVVLPHGLYYGRITPDDAADLIARHEAGRLLPELLRGRSALSAPVQAAQHHARQALAEDRVDTLRPLGVSQIEPATWRVRLAHPAGPVTVTVSALRTGPAVRLTCSSAGPETPRVFRLVDLDLPRTADNGM